MAGGHKFPAWLAIFPAAVGLVVLAALLHQPGKRPTVLIEYDRFGIPIPGTDDPLPRKKMAVAQSMAEVKAADEKALEEKNLEKHEDAMVNTLKGIETQVIIPHPLLSIT
jgi:hypothetical protein